MRHATTVLAVVMLVVNVAYAGDDKKSPEPLPGDAKWNLSELEKNYVIVKTSYDAETREVHWLLEAKNAGYPPSIYFRFLDDDGVRLDTVSLKIKPLEALEKGARVRGVLALPSEENMKEAKKVISTDKM